VFGVVGPNVDVGSASNRDGIGARIRCVSKSGLEQWSTVSTAGSYQSSNDKRVHFGLGADKYVRLLEVTWPSGRLQKIENIKADRVISIRESRVATAPNNGER